MPADHEPSARAGADFSVLDDDERPGAPAHRRRSRGPKVAVAVVVVAAVIGGLLFELASPAPKPAAAPRPAIPFETAVARRADVPVEASGLGTCRHSTP